MPSLNTVLLIGNLTRDPEVKYTNSGKAIADIGLAINRKYTDGNGERKEDVTFVDVKLWGKLADLAGQYLKKGRPVFIEGRLQTESWEDKQTGQKRSKMIVVGEQMQFLGGGEKNEESSAPRSARPARPAKPQRDPDLDVEEDSIPF